MFMTRFLTFYWFVDYRLLTQLEGFTAFCGAYALIPNSLSLQV
jgi:hypothetical protein